MPGKIPCRSRDATTRRVPSRGVAGGSLVEFSCQKRDRPPFVSFVHDTVCGVFEDVLAHERTVDEAKVRDPRPSQQPLPVFA
jgi:hypothetical protein